MLVPVQYGFRSAHQHPRRSRGPVALSWRTTPMSMFIPVSRRAQVIAGLCAALLAVVPVGSSANDMSSLDEATASRAMGAWGASIYQ